ncbi:hypothetical protein HYW58_00245 [Candidatus Kaiserbacteria bacterium]|nr:hypothetical protein [Candidatus Kaiserbacteria bacterium]
MKKDVNGFLVFPQNVGKKVSDVLIGVSIIPDHVRTVFSFARVKKMHKVFSKTSNIFCDAERHSAHIRRKVPSYDMPNEIEWLREDLGRVGIEVMDTPLPSIRDVEFVLAS